jgi:hypothetical protein
MPPLRREALREIPQAEAGLNDAEGAPPRAGRSVDLAGDRVLRPAPSRESRRRRPALAMGEAAGVLLAHTDEGFAQFRLASAPFGHAGEEGAETPREVARAP